MTGFTSLFYQNQRIFFTQEVGKEVRRENKIREPFSLRKEGGQEIRRELIFQISIYYPDGGRGGRGSQVLPVYIVNTGKTCHLCQLL